MARKSKTPQAPTTISPRETVENWERVAAFLRRLAQDVAIVPEFSSEIVRGSLVVAGFLEGRATTARTQMPKEFEDAPAEPPAASPDETLKKGKKREKLAT